MKKILQVSSVAILIVVLANTGCEWEDSGSFNTSLGGGSSVNFSGVYTAKEGQYIIGTNITQLLIAQVGNTVEAWDNNNSYYTGTVGSPGVVSSPDATGEYPAGAVMLEAQIYFSGKNELTDEDVSFIGIFRAVAVDDVKGYTTTETQLSGTSTNVETTITIEEEEFTTETTITSDENQESSTGVLPEGYTTLYRITESNTKYVLDGNWTENGTVSSFSAWANAVSGSFGG